MTDLGPTPSGEEGHTVVEAQDARQGLKTYHMRWVLVISMALAVVAIVVVYLWLSHQRPVPPPAWAHPEANSAPAP